MLERTTNPFPQVILAGAGVVGRAILVNHLQQGFDVLLTDVSDEMLDRAAAEALSLFPDLCCRVVEHPPIGAAARSFSRSRAEHRVPSRPQLLIESIPEMLELKRQFFAEASRALPDCILASNTSNLRIADIFEPLADRTRCIGMHFFMPVPARPLVELIPCRETESSVIERCREHAGGLGKQSLLTGDSPGFVVNRLLVPYLNQALLLLGRGASPAAICRAARNFGMPLSPLRLIDLIGIRTAFDSGRIFWQAFPKRIDPAPILSGMIKAKRLGAAAGGGFFDSSPEEDVTGDEPLHPAAQAVIDRYQREDRRWSDVELQAVLTLPMWLEAAEILADGVVDSSESIELGVRGGLGYDSPTGFFGHFDALGCETILRYLTRTPERPEFFPQALLVEILGCCAEEHASPRDAIRRYVHARRS